MIYTQYGKVYRFGQIDIPILAPKSHEIQVQILPLTVASGDVVIEKMGGS